MTGGIFPSTSKGRVASGVLFLFLLLLALAAPAAAVDRSTGRPFLWKARSETGTAYLMGSVHVLRKDAYPLDRRVEEAFDNADVLVVEADPGGMAPEALASLYRERALYPGGDSLEKHVAPETYSLVSREFGGNRPQVDRIRPWALAMEVSLSEYRKLGFSPEFGLDLHFLRKAGAGKRILELEGIRRQLDLLSGIPEPLQDRMLFYTLSDLPKMREEMEKGLAAWVRGDLGGLEAFLKQPLADHPDLALFYEAIFFGRNREMADKIEGYLKDGKAYFVVVGAGHLIGDEGVVELLKRKGYTVERQ